MGREFNGLSSQLYIAPKRSFEIILDKGHSYVKTCPKINSGTKCQLRELQSFPELSWRRDQDVILLMQLILSKSCRKA